MNLREEVKKLDIKIIELSSLIAEMKAKEDAMGSGLLFRASRIMEKKLKKLKHRRNAAARQTSTALSRRENYKIELARRKSEADDATKEVSRLESELSSAFINGTHKDAISQLRSARIRARNKTKAYLNWAEKAEENRRKVEN